MASGYHDGNHTPTLMAVSSADGKTPVTIYADPSTHRVLTSGLVLTSGRSTAQTAAVASVVQVTVGASDSSYLIWGNANVTAYTSGNFTLQVAYTDETNSAQTPNIQGHFTSGYGTSISGAGVFESQPIALRCKAGTTITIKTAGTFTNLTYNVEGFIQQTA